MLETDVLFAHVKQSDWLKDSAEKILEAVNSGRLGPAYASRETMHELYYIVSKVGLNPSQILTKVGALTSIKNLVWPPTTVDTDLLAFALMNNYKLTSVFDAYHAAACLLADPEKTIVSTDTVYETIPQIKRVDPRDLSKTLRAHDRSAGNAD